MFKLVDNYKTLNGKRIIMIQTIEGLPSSITIDVEENLHNLDEMSNEEITEVALDAFYRKFMMNKFINEAVDITETKAKEITELVERTKKVFADAESQLTSLKERSELAQGSVVEMTEMVFGHEFRISALEGGGLNGEGIESTDETVEDTNTELEGGE